MEKLHGRKSDPAEWGKPEATWNKKKRKRKRKITKRSKKNNR